MSDVSIVEAKVNSTCEDIEKEDKIAALKERLTKDHTALVVNGINGNGTHEQLEEMMDTEIEPNTAITTNGVVKVRNCGSSSKNTEKVTIVESSTQKLHTNGSSKVKEDSKVINIGGKLSLPAGMSVTSLGL